MTPPPTSRLAASSPVLVDTSAWVEYLRETDSIVDQRLRELIVERRDATTEPVIMEVLVGSKTARHLREQRALLLRAPLLPFDAHPGFDQAVSIYRRCRAVGITPRGLIDCMIASVALRHTASLLAFDRDIAAIARVIGVEMDPASLS